MNNHSPFVAIAALMFATGLGIPVMAALNSGLGRELGSAAGATFVLFAVGFLLAALVLAVAGSPRAAQFASARPQFYFGAIFILFYSLSVTWAAPRIGVGNAVFFVLLGQLIAAAAIDHFGVWGALQTSLSMRRAAGIVIMGLGVYLARRTV